MYKLIRPLLFGIDSEVVHDALLKLGKISNNSILSALLDRVYHYEHPSLATTVFGKKFANPIGSASGFDKNGVAIDSISALGFGFLELGGITPRPQPGNPKPRLFRLEDDRAIINRMGFNNKGVDFLVHRIKARNSKSILGVNIAKNNDTLNENAAEDYLKVFLTLRPHCDFIVANVSCPNTPDFRDLQGKAPLRALVTELQRLNRNGGREVPLLVKIAPDLTDTQLDDVIEITLNGGIAGIVATNTTTTRQGLKTGVGLVERMGKGGLSGKPLTARSTEVVRYLFKNLGKKVPIIGVGGIFTAADAYEKIKAGASLVQIYTGLIYEGPGLVKRIKKGLVELLERDGFKTVSDAVGVET